MATIHTAAPGGSSSLRRRGGTGVRRPHAHGAPCIAAVLVACACWLQPQRASGAENGPDYAGRVSSTGIDGEDGRGVKLEVIYPSLCNQPTQTVKNG